MKICPGLLLTLLALSLMAAQCNPSAASQAAGPKITILKPYAQPASAGGTGVVYLTLHNEGNSPDTLLGITSAVAATAELHETKIDPNNDMVKMSPLAKVDLPAGASVSLEPGGIHIMLTNLKRDLKVGDKVEVILNFEKTGTLTVDAGVQEGRQSSGHAMEHSQQDQ